MVGVAGRVDLSDLLVYRCDARSVGPVVGAEFVQRMADVDLDGFHGDAESARDLGVRVFICDESDDADLLGGQAERAAATALALARRVDQIGGEARVDVALSAVLGDGDRFQQLLGAVVFDDHAARSRPECAEQIGGEALIAGDDDRDPCGEVFECAEGASVCLAQQREFDHSGIRLVLVDCGVQRFGTSARS